MVQVVLVVVWVVEDKHQQLVTVEDNKVTILCLIQQRLQIFWIITQSQNQTIKQETAKEIEIKINLIVNTGTTKINRKGTGITRDHLGF